MRSYKQQEVQASPPHLIAETVSHYEFVGIGAVGVAFRAPPPGLRPNGDNHVHAIMVSGREAESSLGKS